MTPMIKKGRNIGAAVGVLGFLAFGVLPGFYFGSYGTLVILNHLMDGPVAAGVVVRMLVVVGTLLGIFCTAGVSIVLGALLGTSVGYVTELFTTPAKAKDETLAKAESK